jgi:hypothetical protein
MGNVKHAKEFIVQLMKEVDENGNASLVARKYNIVPGTVARWCRESKGSAVNEFKEDTLKKHKIKIAEPTELENSIMENKQLKSLVGEKELEIQILRDLLKKTSIPLPPR